MRFMFELKYVCVCVYLVCIYVGMFIPMRVLFMHA